MITFSEALNNNVIRQETFDMLPKKCVCGANLVFNDSMRELMCENKKCTGHIVNRLDSLLSYLGIKLDTGVVETLVDKLFMISPYQIVLIDDAIQKRMITSADVENFQGLIQSIREAISVEFELYQLFEMCGIHKVSIVAKKIVDGFDSVEDFYNELESGQIQYINDRVGIGNTDACALSYNIYELLLSIKDELIFAESKLRIKKYPNKVRIAFNDTVLPFINKSELLEHLNYTYGIKFVHVHTIDDKTDVLIRHSTTSSPKYRAARLINDAYIAKQINANEIALEDIGKKIAGQLKPLGSKVYITPLNEFIERLKVIGVKGE